MTIGKDDVATLTQGRTLVYGSDGDKIGTVSEIYTSDETGEPSWATVKTGLFGAQETFVPLRNADLAGDELRIPHDKETVKAAPRIDPDGHLTLDQEAELYRHYGIDQPRPMTGGRSEVGHPTEQSDTYLDTQTAQTVPTRRTGHRSVDDLGTEDAPGRDSEPATGYDAEPATGHDAEPATERSTADGGGAGVADQGREGHDVTPGERTTRLRRFVVTERVVQTVEEVPEEEDRTDR